MMIDEIMKDDRVELVRSETMGYNCSVEVWEWINNFIPHFTGRVITYPCWDYS